MSNRDSWARLYSDAKAAVSEAAAKVKPHVTVDNAVKAVGLVNSALDVAVKVRQLRPEPQPPAPANGKRK